MLNTKKELIQWSNDLLNYHIPRWDELPDLELYMDQVITFIESNISISFNESSEKIITPAMVNNYVKLKLIPKPIKKRYNKTHLAYLIAISILKQVFTIQQIKDGILFQSMINGEKQAYNSFCQEQELALQTIVNESNINNSPAINGDITFENLTLKMATLAFASKIFAQKSIELQKDLNMEELNIKGGQNEQG